MAAAIGRDPSQTLRQVGGKKQGPDIVFTARSGHLCGAACYRAETFTPELRKVSIVTSALAETMALIVRDAPHRFCISVEVVFPRFPISDIAREEALDAFSKLWIDLQNPEYKTESGIQVRRTAVSPASEGIPWECGLRFLLPVPAREKRRMANNLRDKLKAESDAWARTYQGNPVMFVEEPSFCVGIEADDLRQLLVLKADHSFAAVVCTWAFFVPNEPRGWAPCRATAPRRSSAPPRCRGRATTSRRGSKACSAPTKATTRSAPARRASPARSAGSPAPAWTRAATRVTCGGSSGTCRAWPAAKTASHASR